jgi:hypothetical protein
LPSIFVGAGLPAIRHKKHRQQAGSYKNAP